MVTIKFSYLSTKERLDQIL